MDIEASLLQNSVTATASLTQADTEEEQKILHLEEINYINFPHRTPMSIEKKNHPVIMFSSSNKLVTVHVPFLSGCSPLSKCRNPGPHQALPQLCGTQRPPDTIPEKSFEVVSS